MSMRNHWLASNLTAVAMTSKLLEMMARGETMRAKSFYPATAAVNVSQAAEDIIRCL